MTDSDTSPTYESSASFSSATASNTSSNILSDKHDNRLLEHANHDLLNDILAAYPHEFSEADVCIVSLTDMTTMVLMLFGPHADQGEALSLKFRAAWQEVSQLTPRALNTFNSKFRYVKAFFDDDQDPVIEMDVLVAGTSKQFLQATLRKFTESVSAFEAFLTLADSFALHDD